MTEMASNPSNPLVEVRGLSKVFGEGKQRVNAVKEVSFSVAKGETLGLVGESGSGKSTIGRVMLRLIESTSGQVLYRGEDVGRATSGRMRELRRKLQIIFQDPYASLNPRMRVGDILGEALRVHGLAPGAKAQASRVAQLLDLVGLRPEHADRYPHEFSGGQRQRLAIARCLATKPELIIADEIVSALDVSIQAQIVNLLLKIQRETGLSFIFVTHDVAVARYVGHRVAVMYLGNVVEILPAESLPEAAEHPYTIALLSAVPSMNPKVKDERVALQGEVPSPIDMPSGCAFSTRCPSVMDICRTERPVLKISNISKGDHQVACHLNKGA